MVQCGWCLTGSTEAKSFIQINNFSVHCDQTFGFYDWRRVCLMPVVACRLQIYLFQSILTRHTADVLSSLISAICLRQYIRLFILVFGLLSLIFIYVQKFQSLLYAITSQTHCMIHLYSKRLIKHNIFIQEWFYPPPRCWPMISISLSCSSRRRSA